MLLLITILMTVIINAAGYKVSVQVVDSLSNEPIPYAALFIKGTGNGTLTDDNGRAELSMPSPSCLINVSMMGFRPGEYRVSATDTATVIRMIPDGVQLDEVVVKKKGDHYSKRNNPAVALMERVRREAPDSDPDKQPYHSYNNYDKIVLAISNFGTKDSTEGQNGQSTFAFLNEYVDTTSVPGNPILNISVKEKFSTVYNRSTPSSHREVINATRRVGIDEMVDQASMQTFLDDVLRQIDIYDNDINILQNRFVSPLSHIAADFYKFYITDTVAASGGNLVELTFVPRTSSTFGFTGRFYIAVDDSSYMVKRAVMSVPANINLNFVDNLHITQEYDKSPDGKRLKTHDDMSMNLTAFSSSRGLYVRRTSALTDHSFNEPFDTKVFSNKAPVVTVPYAARHDDDYWKRIRPIPITRHEYRVGEMLTRMRSQPLYYWSEKILKVLVNGYVATSTTDSKVDLGPVNTLISSNDVEGVRLRVGGMTTANLSPRWFGRGYVAYGTKDKKLKYKGELEYSFIDKEYHSREFPIQSLRLTHLYDVDMIGQHYMFTNPDNVFLTFKRMKNRLMTYHRVTMLEFTHEMVNNLTFSATIKNERQEATEFVPFRTIGGTVFSHYNSSTLKLSVRYAPGEKFFQTKTYRVPVNLDAPIFLLEHTYGPKNFAGNTFETNCTEASVQKRFWFSAFGFLDCIVKGGHVWSATPYPSLLLPNANLSYTIQPESFALMDPLEFISDSYVSCDLTYWANGTILNYIPLIKRLKLREVFAFRGYLGSLSDKNTPSLENGLYEFPALALATPMHGRPYMEASVGLDNVFKCLRIDYVWRLSYRHTPGIDRSGLRIAFHVTF